MRTRKHLGTALVTGLMVLVLAGCGGSAGKSQPASGAGGATPQPAAPAPAPAPAKKIVFKIGHTANTDLSYHKGSVKIKELIEAKAGDKIEVQVFPAGQLGQEKDLVEGVKLGTVQMTVVGAAMMGNFCPATGVYGLPYMIKGSNEAEQYANFTKVVRSEVNQKLVEDCATKTGLRIVDNSWWYGNRHVTTKKSPVNTPDDVKGLKIRTPDAPIHTVALKLFGASVVPMGFSEVYTAMQTGTLDGQENPINTIYTNKFYEVQGYVNLTGHMTQNQVIVMSDKYFKELPPDLQKVVTEAVIAAGEYQSKLQLDANAKDLENLKAAGMKVVTPNLEPFIKATEKAHEQFSKDISPDLVAQIKKLQQ